MRNRKIRIAFFVLLIMGHLGLWISYLFNQSSINLVSAESPKTAAELEKEKAKKSMPWDKGPDRIDISQYPKEMQEIYTKVFSKKCSKCHTLSRPVNAPLALPKEWKRYIKRMMRKPGSGINPVSGKKIYKFLVYDSKIRKKELIEAKLSEQAGGKKKTEFPFTMETKKQIPVGLKTMTVTEYVLKEKEGEYQKVLNHKSISQYDKKGNKTKTMVAKPDGKLDSKLIYQYDKKGNLIEMRRYNIKGSLDLKLMYNYDQEGNKIEWVRWYTAAQTLLENWIPQYAEKGNKITEVSGYDADKKLFIRVVFKYDTKGNVIEKREYGPKRALKDTWFFKYQYAEKGNLIEKTEYQVKEDKEILLRQWSYAYEFGGKK